MVQTVFFEWLQRIAYGLRQDKRYRYYDKIKKNLTLSRTEIISLQNKLIRKLIQHAYSHTIYYREIMDECCLKPEDIQTKKDLQKLPLLTKSTIRKNIDKIKSDDQYSRQLKLVTSGGSSGNQAIIYKSSYFEQISRAFSLRNNLLANWRPGDRTVWIWGSPIEHEQIKNSLMAHIGFIVNQRLILNAYNYSVDDFPFWVEKIIRFKPRVLYGYASIMLQFSKYLIENKIVLPSIKVVVSTTETLKERNIIERAFQTQVFNQYGCREILAIGIEIKNNIMMIADDCVVLNMSETGEFVITALHSFGFPLINYKLGDYGDVFDSYVAINKLPFSSFNLHIGRITDNFLTREKRIVSSSALGTYISTFGIRIREQQIVQEDFNRFVINFVIDDGFDSALYQSIIQRVLEEYFGSGNEIHFQSLDSIPPEKSGKKLMFKRTFLID